MSLEEYKAKVVAQGGVCAICFGVNISGIRLSVDHNHETGVIRGLLCDNCNRGLGHMQDSIDILMSAVAYLKEYDG